MAMVEKAHLLTGRPVGMVLNDLGLPRASYYRWKDDKREGSCEAVSIQGGRSGGAVGPTPEEAEKVKSFALSRPTIGYKRLSWMMIDADIVYLRPYQVYGILDEANLQARCIFRPKMNSDFA